MIVAIDIGNSNIKVGVYLDEKRLAHFRLKTNLKQTESDYLGLLKKNLADNELDPKAIEEIVLSSVVTELIPLFLSLCRKMIGKNCILIDQNSFLGMKVNTDNPEKVGTDRLVNAFSAYHLYQQLLIVVDFGTATTFNVIDSSGTFQGGVIAPGLMLSLNALSNETSQLPTIKLERPKSVIGKNTVECMQSGIIFGYAGLVDSIIQRIQEELGQPAKVIATGGLAGIIQPVSSKIEEVIDDLTLRGLYLISQKRGKN